MNDCSILNYLNYYVISRLQLFMKQLKYMGIVNSTVLYFLQYIFETVT